MVIIRVFLALLALCLSLPAMASPACAPKPDMAMHHTGSAKDHGTEEKATSHLCAGCVPVADWLRERIAAPVPVADALPDAMPARLTIGEGPPPALPPPRTA